MYYIYIYTYIHIHIHTHVCFLSLFCSPLVMVAFTYSPYSTPSEIDLGLFWADLQTWKGNIYFAE